MGRRTYDYVIVGGGSAGCVLANRLSADPSTRVLVLEAGRPDYPWDVFVQMPGAMWFPMGNRLYDWRYETEPEEHLGGRRIRHARGKLLGGSSSINGMVFQRGNPLDYDHWAADFAMPSWDYAHCLPYFKRMETSAIHSPFRGEQGPLVLERAPLGNPLAVAFLAAAEEAGHRRSEDFNGYRQEGFGPMDRNVRRGRRLSASGAYLRPVMDRPNLDVACRAFAHRVLFDGARAVGVEYSQGLKRAERALAGEVILCGGAFNSPQLLQLSGVGAAEELGRLGIDVVADLPGVGENLQDHLEVYIQHLSRKPVSIGPGMKWRNRPRIGLEWLLARRGTGASNQLEAGGFVRTNERVDRPNLLFHFLPAAIDLDGSLPPGDHGYQAHITPVISDARGSVKIRSKDPATHPSLRFNYLSTEQDREEWIDSVRIAREILAQPAFAEFDGGEITPGPRLDSEEEILDFVRRRAETSLHPIGTCRMGVDESAVVDPLSMRVLGTEGLRVADASVMPAITNGNTYAPVMMIAEKAVDLIAANTPLPAEPLDFFRAHPGAAESEEAA